MKTAVIVGHGPSPKGKSWGSQIDQADIVIRMFNCVWQDEVDYGTKYTAGLVTADQRSLSWFRQSPVRRPASWWIYSPSGSLFTIGKGLDQELVTLTEERRVALSLGANTDGHPFAFTRGTAATLHAIRKRPERIVMVGLDEVVSGQFSVSAYPQACHDEMAKNADLKVNNPRPAGASISDCHDLGIEMAVIRHMAQSNGVSVMTAEEAWS